MNPANPYSRSTQPAHRHVWAYTFNACRGREVTEAHIFAWAADDEPTLSRAQVDNVINTMIDSGVIRPTIIDGGVEFGFVPSLTSN